MEVINWELVSQLTAGALVIIALFIVRDMTKVQNAALAAASKTSVDAVTATFNTSIQTLKEAQDGQRLFYQAKVDDLFKELTSERQERRTEVEKLQKRISDLECEVEEKDKRIETLEGEIGNKDGRIKALEGEVERLKGQLNGKADKPKKGGK